MALTTTANNDLGIAQIGRIQLTGAEISAFDAASRTLFVAAPGGVSRVDLSNPTTPTLLGRIDFSQPPFAFGNDVNSVAVHGGLIAVAVAAPVKTDPGRVFLIDAQGNLVQSITVGGNPDMLTFTADGSRILVANEGEMISTAQDADGSVSIITLGAPGAATVATATFDGFSADALRAEGVRVFAGLAGTEFANTTLAQDLEPEYIALSPDGLTAMVTLQEANAVAILDIATGRFTDIVPLGLKDFSALPFDGSDRDGAGNTTAINFQTGRPVFGTYMPDAIASFRGADGQTYYVMANEGDNRDDFIAPDETIRLGNAGYDLDDTLFPNEAALKANSALGRLNVINYPGLRGDTDNDGDIDQILTYGGRSFSIVDAAGNQVFDSGAQTELLAASFGLVATGGVGYDDTRSDDKGSEPEGVVIGVISGRTYAFLQLERSNLTAIYDVTSPADVQFVGTASFPGDVAPEGATFVSAADSPSGTPLLIVSNEGSATVSVYAITPAFDAFQIGGTGVDRLDGSAGRDKLVGNDGADVLSGLAGNDRLEGGLGADVLRGQDGDDTLDGGGDADNLQGGAGIDILLGGDGNDVLIGGTGADAMTGGAGDDLYYVDDAGDTVVELAGGGTDTVLASVSFTLSAEVERGTLTGSALDLTGNASANLLIGNALGNAIAGGDGDDILYGEGGGDQLTGGLGADFLRAGEGDDVLDGGAGADILQGGAGADLFRLAALSDSGATFPTADKIQDLSRAQGDRIDLSALDAIAGGGDDAFGFVGTAGFSGIAGELRVQASGTNQFVFGDVDGDTVADFMLVVVTAGNLPLAAGDFIL
ncbi:choice-of-anchor I family protein [Sphingomonas sp. 1P06PA]|uniref:choice-of-anchor I family protein n=1 Tax=Sphingomonas sp. 1P06PA TaxID=554121 RepID=UPI0039A760EB